MSLSQILLNQPLTSVSRTSEEIRRTLQCFLEARKLTIPAPERPRLAPIPAAQESQEEYGVFDLDYDDPALLAALGENGQPALPSDEQIKDGALRTVSRRSQSHFLYRMMHIFQAIDKTHLVWLCWRRVSKLVQDPSEGTSSTRYYNDVDNWLDCWLGCADVVIRSGGKESCCVSIRRG